VTKKQQINSLTIDFHNRTNTGYIYHRDVNEDPEVGRFRIDGLGAFLGAGSLSLSSVSP